MLPPKLFLLATARSRSLGREMFSSIEMLSQVVSHMFGKLRVASPQTNSDDLPPLARTASNTRLT